MEKWLTTPAAWWQFWMPQSGIRGGLILGLTPWVLYWLLSFFLR